MQALPPKQWPNTDSLAKDLRLYSWKEQWFDHERKRLGDRDFPTLIKESILGNTFSGLRVHLKGADDKNDRRNYDYRSQHT